MHYIKYQWFPNNEIRAIHYYRGVRKTPARPVLLWTQFVILLIVGVSEVFPAEGNSLSLDISSDFDAMKDEIPHKRTKFGQNAKNTILRMGGALDTICSQPNHYVFLTGTLPGSTSSAYRAMAVHSSWMVDAIRKWLNKYVKCKYWFFVWELQRRGALHIHYCCYVPDDGLRKKLIQSFPAKWRDILDSVGERASVDMWQREDGTTHARDKTVLQAYAQEVKKSVAAYISGYCGGAKDKHGMDEASPYYPARWWGASRELSSLLKDLTRTTVECHSTYSTARNSIERHSELARDYTETVYKYQHRVGVGSTVISYQPINKHKDLWEVLTMSKHPPAEYPNASSWIASIHSLLTAYPLYLRALKKRSLSELQPLLRELEDSTWLDSLTRYTLHQSHLRAMHRCTSVLSLNTLEQHSQELTLKTFVPPIWLHCKVAHLLRWNPQGWLSLESDLPVRLTDCWSFHILGTKSDETPGQGVLAETPLGPLPNQLCLFPTQIIQPQPPL